MSQYIFYEQRQSWICCFCSWPHGSFVETLPQRSTCSATPPASTSDTMGQHHKTEGITFGAGLIGDLFLPYNWSFHAKRTHHFRARKYAASTCCLASLMLLRRSESDRTSEPSTQKEGNKKKLRIGCLCARSSTSHRITFPLYSSLH